MRTRSFSLLLLLSLGVSPFTLCGQSNQYLHFDGEDDFAMTENAAQYVAGADGVSMTGWFYTDALVYGQGMMGIRGGGDDAGEMYIIQLNDGLLECRFISSDGFHESNGPAGTAVAGEWQHIAWVFDGSSIELFVNGSSVSSASASGVVESMNRPFGIGKSIQSGFNFVFGGRVDEMTLWSRGVTQAEIQDMMANELTGEEEGLELYYKMDQGVPGADNTSITELISEVGEGMRNATLMNFSLTGLESNFSGVLEDGFQSISFPQLPDVLITEAPFTLGASVNSGLPITYTIVSGPATVAGDVLSVDGTAGEVVVRASQEGNDVFDPAADVEVSFDVVDPATILPGVDLRNPIEGDFYASALTPILLASMVDVEYPALFDISAVTFEVDGVEVPSTDHGNSHHTAWWTPDDYGSHTLSVTATHSEGTAHTESVTFNITNTAVPQTVAATVDVWADVDDFSVEVEAVLPSYMGVYDHIEGLLAIDCPPGGCDPWDRVSSMEVRGHDGEWYEIIRYLTPYGVACDHNIDLTDFMSLLQGKVRFRVNLGTQGNGFLYSLDLDYQLGTPTHAYSSVQKLWYQTYAFGDMADLTPTETYIVEYPDNAMASTLKVVSSGHGWGDNNTGNAAEFHHDIHHFWVNGSETFEQDNWYDCDPNPDGCQPQLGTWYFNRAGWCPGAIAQFFDYDMSPYVDESEVDLQYRFDEDYVDFCHPNNPNCVSGQTCPNCDDGFNPHLIVTSYLISLGDEPLDEISVITDIDEVTAAAAIDFGLYPNPSAGRFSVDLTGIDGSGTLAVHDVHGRLLLRSSYSQGQLTVPVDLGEVDNGIYLVSIETEEGTAVRKLVIE